MKRVWMVLVVALLGSAATATVVGSRAQSRPSSSAEIEFRKAEELEKAKGDLPKAIEIYKKLADGSDPALAERAKRALARLAALQAGPLGGPQARGGGAGQALETGFPSKLISTDLNIDALGVVRVSPSGRYASGFRLAGGDWYLRDLERGTGRTLLTCQPSCSGLTTFAPNGRFVAALIHDDLPRDLSRQMLQGERSGAELAAVPRATRLSVASVTADAAGPLVLDLASSQPYVGFPAVPLAWSPDSRHIAYAIKAPEPKTYEIRIVDVQSRLSRTLGVSITGSPVLSWSRTGDELAVHAAESVAGTVEVQLVRIATAATRSLTIPAAEGVITRGLVWTTAGEIVIRHDKRPAGEHSTTLLSSRNGSTRPTCTGNFTDGDRCLEITPDGLAQLVWSASSTLQVRNLATGVDRPLTVGSGEEQPGMLSEDGRIALFQSNREGRWGLYAAPLAAAPVTAPVRISWLTGGPVGYERLTWIDDGFVARWTYRASNIMRVNISAQTGRPAGPPARLTQESSRNFQPSISPDGRQIAYWSQHGLKSGLALMDADGSRERVVFEGGPAFPMFPLTWGSAQRLFFSYVHGGVSPETRLVTLDAGSNAVQSVAPLTDVVGRTSTIPGRNEVVYFDENARTFVVRSLTDRTFRPWSALQPIVPSAPNRVVYRMLFSPDGGRVAYLVATQVSQGSFGCVPTCEVGLLTISSGVNVILPLQGFQRLAAWSPDGRFLLSGVGQPAVFDTQTGESWPLADRRELPDWDGEGSWSPDGSFVVVTRSTQETEWRQWKGVTSDVITNLASLGARNPR